MGMFFGRYNDQIRHMQFFFREWSVTFRASMSSSFTTSKQCYIKTINCLDNCSRNCFCNGCCPGNLAPFRIWEWIMGLNFFVVSIKESENQFADGRQEMILLTRRRNNFPRRPSGAPLHTLSKWYDVSIGCVTPSLILGSVLLYLRSPMGGCCSISDDLSYSYW